MFKKNDFRKSSERKIPLGMSSNAKLTLELQTEFKSRIKRIAVSFTSNDSDFLMMENRASHP